MTVSDRPASTPGSGRVLLVLLVCLAMAAGLFSSCRLVSGEILCRRDRDCPDDLPDAGRLYCTSWDAGIGTCTSNDDFQGDLLVDFGDGGVDVPKFPDAGALDGGS